MKFYYFEIAVVVISLLYLMGLVLMFIQMTFDFIRKILPVLIVVVFIAVTIVGITFFGSWFNTIINQSILLIIAITSIAGAVVGAVAMSIYKSNKSATQSTSSHIANKTISTMSNVLNGTVSTASSITNEATSIAVNLVDSAALTTAAHIADKTTTKVSNVLNDSASTGLNITKGTVLTTFSLLNRSKKRISKKLKRLGSII